MSKRLLPWLLCLIFAVGWGGSWLSGVEESARTRHGLARNAFFADFAYTGCVTSDQAVEAAQARGLQTRKLDEMLWCIDRQDIVEWLEVQIEPPLLLSTADENAAFLGFDARGCMVPWSYATCD